MISELKSKDIGHQSEGPRKDGYSYFGNVGEALFRVKFNSGIENSDDLFIYDLDFYDVESCDWQDRGFRVARNHEGAMTKLCDSEAEAILL